LASNRDCQRNAEAAIILRMIAKHWGALAVLLVLSEASGLDAQQPDRRPLSPEGRSATQIGGVFDERVGFSGGKWIEISYGRPIRRGRDLFGPEDFVDFLNDGAPVWRAGANVSTRLVNEMPLQFGTTLVPPGEYTVFIELARNKWTLILSTWKAQTRGYRTNDPNALFGAYEYTPDKDLVRVPMKLETLLYAHDQLHWEFLDVTPAGGRLAIIWEKQMASVPFTVVK
jgi:hypothetical protein